MRSLSFAALNSYAGQHPAVRAAKEISVWAWIAGAVVFVIALAAVLSPNHRETLTGHPLLPLATESTLDIANPGI